MESRSLSPTTPPSPSVAGAAPSNPKNALPEFQPPARPQIPTNEDLEAAEIELRYSLHRAKADLGEPITVERHGRRLGVRGVVETQERKQQVLAAFAELMTVGYVDLEIQTVAEARQAAPRQDRKLQAAAPLESASGTPTADPILFSSGRLPIQDRLGQYFASRLDTEDGTQAKGQQVADFSNRVADLASAALDEAWALRRLAHRYPVERSMQLKVQAKWLLETMVSDHVRALSNHAAELQRLVEPAFLWILRSPEAEEHLPARGTISLEDGYWNESVARLFEDTRKIHDLALALLAGRQLPAARHPSPDTPTEGSLQPADQAMIELLAAFRRVDGSVRQLEHVATKRFAPAREVSAEYELR